jgi:hypothetical protein
MRKVSMILGLALFALAGSVRAQDEAPAPAPTGDTAAAPAPAPEAVPAPSPAAASAAKLTIGADAAFQLPLGNFADVTGMGFGGLLRGEYNLIPNLNGTLRAGYIYSLKKDTAGFKTAVDNIPIWVGGKYFINEMIFAGAELGLNMLKTRVDGSVDLGGISVGGSGSSTENKFGANVGVGVLLSGLEIRAGFEILDFGHSKDSMAILVNVGYDFFKM